MDTGELLNEREKTHGPFNSVAVLSQDIKFVLRGHPEWGCLRPWQRESLDMIANKIARILSGDPMFADHWDDIAGYAKLVADRLRKPD